MPVGWLATAPSSCSCHCLGPSCELACYRHCGGSLHDGASAGAVSWAHVKTLAFLSQSLTSTKRLSKKWWKTPDPMFFLVSPCKNIRLFSALKSIINGASLWLNKITDHPKVAVPGGFAMVRATFSYGLGTYLWIKWAIQGLGRDLWSM